MATVVLVLLQVALAGCGLFGAPGAVATPSAAAAPAATASASPAPVTVARATYGPGETLGALAVAHVITPVVKVLGSAAAPLRLAAVQFVTDRMGWAVGSRCPASGVCQGIVLGTRDGGASWSGRVIAHSALTGVQFLDAQDGWAYGPDALLATADGGARWTPVALPAGLRAVAALSASFVDPRDGWLVVHLHACGGQGCAVRVYATADGGANWRLIAGNAPPGTAGGSGAHKLPWAEYVAGGDLGGGTGWMLAQTPAGVIETTTDGGGSWSRKVLNSGGFPVAGGFASNGAGWVAATAGTNPPTTRIWSSASDGATWRLVATLPGRVGPMAASADGASAWVPLRPAGGSACTGGTCGETVAVLSALGTPAAVRAVPAGYRIVRISALDGTTAWAVASGPAGYAILATTDGARKWRRVYPASAAAVTPVGSLLGFENGSDGWAVGSTTDGSALLRTLDGGSRWTVAGRVPVRDPVAAGFVDPRHGWVASQQAAYVTADGGASWSALRLPLPKGGAIAAMGFSTAKDGWLLPARTKAQPSAHLMVTHDGGRTWTSTGAGPFLRVAFATAALGWAIGPGAHGHVHLLATRDGGLAWKPVADLGPQHWNPAAAAPLWVGARLAGASPDDVWVASGDHLLQSIDGGHTWVDLHGPAVTGLAAAAGGYLWVRAGTALYSVTGAGRRWTQVGWAGGG